MNRPEGTIDQMLTPVTIEHLDIINHYLNSYPQEDCDFNINVVMSWGVNFGVEYAIYHERLIMFNPTYNFLLFPVGHFFTAEELYILNNCCEKVHKNVEIMVVPREYIEATTDLERYFTIYNDIDWNDYVYSVDSLVNLPGKKLAKKKNLISQFLRLYPDYHSKSISAEDYQEIIDFCHYWKKFHNTEDNHLIAEFGALKHIFQNWNHLPCQGLKIYVQDHLCAFSIFSPQTKEMATVHFEKYDPIIKGAGQIINQETAKLLYPKFIYVNREQDMGIEGIRQAKRSYQPIRQVEFYRLKSK